MRKYRLEGTQSLEKARAFWDLRAKEFSKIEVAENDETLSFLKKHMDLKGKSVLDVGFGAGRYLVALAKEGMEIFGVELSPEMFSHAMKKLEENGISYEKESFRNSAWEDADFSGKEFDLIFLSNSPALSSARELERVLSLAGEGILITGHMDRKDSLLQRLQTEFGLEEDRGYVGKVIPAFYELIERGYYPEVHFKTNTFRREYGWEECIERYGNLLFGGELTEDRREVLERAAADFLKDGKVISDFTFVDGYLFLRTEAKKIG